jgi:hypothetical protein
MRLLFVIPSVLAVSAGSLAGQGCPANETSAQLVTATYEGTVIYTQVPTFSAGTPFVVTFTYDANTPNSNCVIPDPNSPTGYDPDPNYGIYDGAVNSLSFTAGAYAGSILAPASIIVHCRVSIYSTG